MDARIIDFQIDRRTATNKSSSASVEQQLRRLKFNYGAEVTVGVCSVQDECKIANMGYGSDDISCNDFENMLLNPEEMKGYLKRLKDNCNNYGAKIERAVLDSLSKSSECVKQVEKTSESIVQLTSQKKELKCAIEKIKLEQKLIEKKTMNDIKEIEKIKEDIANIKEKREKLSLEMVDIEQETQKSKVHMKKQWEALKRACKPYKDLLDIHIDVDNIDHVEHVTVTFFWSENPTDKKFFVVLVCQDNCWKVKKIEPELSMENKYHLNNVVHFSKESEVANVTSLLCELRTLFLRNYFS